MISGQAIIFTDKSAETRHVRFSSKSDSLCIY